VFRWNDVQAEFERARAADHGDTAALKEQVQGVVRHIFTGRDSSHGWAYVAAEMREEGGKLQFGSAREEGGSAREGGDGGGSGRSARSGGSARFADVVAAAASRARKSSSLRRAAPAPTPLEEAAQQRPLTIAEQQA
jgi:hypothetical protein